MKSIAVARMLAVALMAINGASLSAQQIQFAVQRAPYYVGEPVVVQVSVSRVNANIELSCQLKGVPAAGLTVQGPQENRSVRSLTQIINGRMTRHESIDYQFGFVVTADTQGEYMVGPFELVVDGKAQEVAGRKLTFGKLENDPDMRVTVLIPQQAVYVGQEVPVSIRWAFAGTLDELRHAYARLQIRSPLFDQFPFRQEPPRTDTRLSVTTAQGDMEFDAKTTREQIEGRDFIVVAGTCTMVPDSPGQFQNIPVTCRTEKLRDPFDMFRTRSTPAFAVGEPISFSVKPIPRSGRPASFAGAVGHGYSIDVSANRSVVRVGDPISLNVTVRGDGNLAKVSLPPLDAGEGLSGDQFQIPEDDATGTVAGNAKQFKVTVRVKDPQVSQIPAIAFSWFDPSQEKFVTAQSKPIALQVMDAQVVSAADVISSTSGGRSEGTRESASGQKSGGDSAAPNQTIMSFVGANLAITRDPARLLATGSSITAPSTVVAGCYVLSGVLVIGGIVLRRRASRDQELLGQKKRLKQLLGRVEKARRLRAQEACQEIARVLRDLLAELSVPNRSEIDQLTAHCDNIIYTTSSGADGDVAEIASEAERLVREAAQQ